MNILRRLGPALATLAVTCSGLLAQEKPAEKPRQPGGSFAALKADFDGAMKKWREDLRAEIDAKRKKNPEAMKTITLPTPTPFVDYSSRFLAIAERDPDSPEALDALKMTLQISYGPDGKPAEPRAKAIKILADHYAAGPQISGILKMVANFSDDEARALIDGVIAHNPDRKIQAEANQTRAYILGRKVEIAAELLKDSAFRAEVEKSEGRDAVARWIAEGPKATQELAAVAKTLREKYGDLVVDLSIGQPVPEAVSRDLDGKTARLADLKGKVVVLDIWATWCGPCKAMIPHEREMVERLKDKPFALVSISADDKPETLRAFLAQEKMPWTHWWEGPEGKLIQEWDVRSFPTIYVLDAKGIIRHKDLRGDELEKAVDALLKEAGATKAAG